MIAVARRRTILITGSGSGIGRDCMKALARRGHKVLASTHTAPQAEKLRERAAVDGLPVEAFKLDITNGADRAKTGELAIDVLINNAAIGESGSLAEVPLDRVRSAFETNLFATLALTQLCLRGMIARHYLRQLPGRASGRAVPSALCNDQVFAVSCGRRFAPGIETAGSQRPCECGRAWRLPHWLQSKDDCKKYEWMRQGSYFQDQLETLKASEHRMFALLELRSTAPIVRKIVQAAEADRPRFRYSAPWWQSTGVQLLRVFGK